ncbi:MAG: hypothetical protein HY306_08295 [Nitrosomonadales bacterium]|nr:hypothetical protein [Nitrosomonadales bacterium]
MTLALARSTYSSFGAMQTFGTSGAAEYVNRQIAEGRAQLRKAISFGAGTKAVEDLHGIATECSFNDWDGYGAQPVGRETIQQAERFLNALPLEMVAPSVGAEPDGQITFEWYQSPRRILSVSVSPEGDLHYAALLGYRKAYGTEPFFGEIPADILRLVHRAVSE